MRGAEGGGMLGPPGCVLKVSTWVQRASPVRMGGLYMGKCYPYVSVSSLSVLLSPGSHVVESFLPTPFSEAV